jgi:arylsulfatase A-like enzyme
MKQPFNRRDFLKLAGLLPLSLAGLRTMRALGLPQSTQNGPQNVLIVAFDALSALNISLYGYGRETTPNLDKLSKRAIVYRNHFAGANFTTPGTASLLTGTYSWTNRALNSNGKVAELFINQNIFHAFQNHYRIGYSHSGWVNTFFKQFSKDLEELVPREKLFLASLNDSLLTAFKNDEDISSISWVRAMKKETEGYSYSLFLSTLYEDYRNGEISKFNTLFPRGLPSSGSDDGFLLEQAIDWLGNRLAAIPQPFLGYFHFLPPHYPYHTSANFYGRFDKDGLKVLDKPNDVFAPPKNEKLSKIRTTYDEFLLYVDQEFGRLYNFLETSGLLKNTWVVFTSDHGEMFERGISGHSTPAIYQPVIRIPLLIFEPGRETGMEITTPTSAIDVLPTLLQVTGQPIPNWIEGCVLPPYAPTSPDPNRSIYALRAQNNAQFAPLNPASVMLVKGRYKLVYYFGYPELKGSELVHLFDIEADPEELKDRKSKKPEIAAELLSELKAKLAEVDRPYRS